VSGLLDLDFEVIADESPIPVDATTYESLCGYVLNQLDRGGLWVVTVALVGDEALRTLHAQFMDEDSVTDVMTFPAGEPGQEGGDIVISVERAADQGPEHGFTTEQEVRFLFVHGLLHLCGWDDQGPAERERMLARQSELLKGFDAARAPT
jgi:probable rRNA maturation factor